MAENFIRFCFSFVLDITGGLSFSWEETEPGHSAAESFSHRCVPEDSKHIQKILSLVEFFINYGVPNEISIEGVNSAKIGLLLQDLAILLVTLLCFALLFLLFNLQPRKLKQTIPLQKILIIFDCENQKGKDFFDPKLVDKLRQTLSIRNAEDDGIEKTTLKKRILAILQACTIMITSNISRLPSVVFNYAPPWFLLLSYPTF